MLIVVRIVLPRTTPCRPIVRITRATVQRATAIPSRPSCRQTLRTADAIDAEVLVVHAADLDLHSGIAMGPCRQPARIGAPGGMGMIRRRGDRQDAADRLDPVA